MRTGTYDVVILDAVGRQVMHRPGALNGNSLQLDPDIAGSEPGMYRGTLVLEGAERSDFRFVKQ